jgi:putative endonuclease
MNYFVYVIQSSKDHKFYIGSTANVEARLMYHNSGRQRSTRKRIPFHLVYTETFNAKGDALKREKYIKSLKGGEAFRRLISKIS